MRDFPLSGCRFFVTFVNSMRRSFRHIIPSRPGIFCSSARRMLFPSLCKAAILSLVANFAVGCSSATSGDSPASDSDSIPSDAVVMVGDSILTRREVESRIPAGTSPEDSTALFHSIVDGWLDRMLLTDIAARNIEDMEEIDRLLEDYRMKLLIARYCRSLRESRADGISQKDIDEYYKANSEEMALDNPVVKGLYVKLPSDAPRLRDIRNWIMTATPDAIDNLEKYGLTDAIEYSIFDNRWTDWTAIAGQIPYNFGNPDEFVARRRNFETTFRGFTYLLHISAFLPSGDRTPKEIAEPLIRERLATERGDRYEKSIISKIYNEALHNGRLKYINYTPPDVAPGIGN